ncbi:unnamed protein product [Allacma fusca]|uniref:Uncharacterized protein n=1 Tax=Allacma fusca TaxID=39272 RepID=A0A8J2P018_9HEXA|nr:unnamed protein product [Allacma fusca]
MLELKYLIDLRRQHNSSEFNFQTGGCPNVFVFGLQSFHPGPNGFLNALVNHVNSQESYETVSKGGRGVLCFINATVWRQIVDCLIPRTIANIQESLHTHEISEFKLSEKGSLKSHRLP